MIPDEITEEIPALVALQRGRDTETTLSDLPPYQAPVQAAQRRSAARSHARTAPRPNWLLYAVVVAACGFLGWAGATILTAPQQKPYKAPVAVATPKWLPTSNPTIPVAHRPTQGPARHHPVPTPHATHTHAKPTPTAHPTPKPSHSVHPAPTPTTVSTPGSKQPPPAPSPSPKPSRTHSKPTPTPSVTQSKPSNSGTPTQSVTSTGAQPSVSP